MLILHWADLNENLVWCWNYRISVWFVKKWLGPCHFIIPSINKWQNILKSFSSLHSYYSENFKSIPKLQSIKLHPIYLSAAIKSQASPKNTIIKRQKNIYSNIRAQNFHWRLITNKQRSTPIIYAIYIWNNPH